MTSQLSLQVKTWRPSVKWIRLDIKQAACPQVFVLHNKYILSRRRTTAPGWILTGCPAAISHESPATSSKNSSDAVNPEVLIIQFLIAHSLRFHLSPSDWTLDGCCSNVSWPGGSFPLCSAKKEKGRSGERSWDGRCLRFCPISAQIHCKIPSL